VTSGRAKKNVKRKITVLILWALLIALCLSAEAQQPKKISRVGLLIAGSASYMSASINSFRHGLRELGYIEGKTVLIEERFADAKLDRLTGLAAELVDRNVDVVVTAGTPGVEAWKKATKTIPIVFVAVGDPVASGMVSSLARPGGNITGISQFAPELSGKRLEILKEAFPKVTRVAYLWTPELPGTGLRGMEDVAQFLGLQVQSLEVRSPNDLDAAFEAALRERSEALTAATAPVINTHHKRILNFAMSRHLPAIYSQKDWVESGGLMSYGVSFDALFRRAAIYVDKILKGAKAADLPVEQPTKFELVINLKAAQELGFKIPPKVLMWADKVIK